MTHPDTVDDHVEGLLARLDLVRKVRLVSGADMWSTPAEPSVGLRRMVFSDGPAGVRGESWDERDPSTSLPSPTAFAATWDEGLVRRIGGVLAGEARRKGVDVVLGPTVNLHRSPLGGRHFEGLSEDPLLTGRIARSYVRGLQEHGVGATPKHYVANDSETDRFTVDVRMDERTLRELYLAPFADVVDEGAWLVMSAYNGLDGTTMTESPLLDEPLKGEWGFDGVVISDWTAVRSTEAAACAGNDLAMPGSSRVWGEPLVAAVREGSVPESAIDAKVRRLLRLAARVGALEGAPPTVPGTATPREDPGSLAREVAASAMVLARNEHELLPLNESDLHRVAVIGPNAADARIQGGGSAQVVPGHVVSPLEGLRGALRPDVEVTHATGTRTRHGLDAIPHDRLVDPDTGEQGVRVRFRDAEGTLLRTEHRGTSRLVWLGEDLTGVARVEVDTRFHADQAGTHLLGVAGVGRFHLTAAGTTLVNGVIEVDTDDPAEALLAPPRSGGELELAVGDEVELVATHDIVAGMMGEIVVLCAESPALSPEAELRQAVEAARAADVAVVVVGTTQEIESEGFDRDTLALPGGQDELVHAVAAANPDTVVVVNSGAPVELPWRDEVAGVLLTWFPGQEYGRALADVVLGAREPGGRLPTTWAASEDTVPVLNTRPTNGRLDYAEGLDIGYRAWARADAEPAYPFGHGLGYTTWEYRAISDPTELDAERGTSVRVRLANTGRRRGREVVQVYLVRPDSSVDRPALWLAGFAAVTAEAGREVEVDVPLRPESVRHWSVSEHGWRVEGGTFTVLAGRSCLDLPLASTLTVAG